MSGGSKTTGSQTTTNLMNPAMQSLMGNASSVMNNGTAFAPYTASMVTPFSSQTTQALGGMQNTANAAMPSFATNFQNIQNMTNDGGLNDLQDQQVSRLQGMAGGNGLNSMQQTAYDRLDPTASGNGLNAEQQKAFGYLDPIASGSMMSGNPYLNDLIKRSGDDIRYQSGLNASAMGRYGSGGHEGVQAKAIGDMAGNLRYQNYGDEANRRDNAINSLFGMGSTGASQKNAAIGSQYGIGTQGQAQQNDAIGSLFNAGTQQRQNQAASTGQLQDAYNAQMSPYNTLMGVGGQYEDLYSRQLADQSRIFSAQQNAQTAPINWMANLLGGAGGGQTVQQTSTPTNPLGGAVGGAMAGFDTFGGPLGALFGGATGAFL